MEHWVEVYVTIHRDRGDESTASDYCRWEYLPETTARLQRELLADFREPIGRLYPTFRVRLLSVAPKLSRRLERMEVRAGE